MYTICGKCSARASGTSPAHCTICHKTFSSAGGFERHRDKRGEGSCKDPVSVGFVLRVHGEGKDRWECWERAPMTDEKRRARFGDEA